MNTLATIHPTSIIDKQAQIAADVEIGPYCVIQGQVTIGQGCRLVGHVYVIGPVVIGKGNTIFPNACIGTEPQDRKYDPSKPTAGVVIGDNNHIREGVTIHRATGQNPTTLGHHNFIMAYAHLGHDVVVGNDCNLSNGANLGGHVVVQNNVAIGGGAGVHQFCRLGRLSMLSGTVAVVQDLPPFCTVYNMRTIGSLNLIGLRRAGYRQHIRPLQQAFNMLFRNQRVLRNVIPMVREKLGHDPLVTELLAFISESKRGITEFQGSRTLERRQALKAAQFDLDRAAEEQHDPEGLGMPFLAHG